MSVHVVGAGAGVRKAHDNEGWGPSGSVGETTRRVDGKDLCGVFLWGHHTLEYRPDGSRHGKALRGLNRGGRTAEEGGGGWWRTEEGGGGWRTGRDFSPHGTYVHDDGRRLLKENLRSLGRCSVQDDTFPKVRTETLSVSTQFAGTSWDRSLPRNSGRYRLGTRSRDVPRGASTRPGSRSTHLQKEASKVSILVTSGPGTTRPRTKNHCQTLVCVLVFRRPTNAEPPRMGSRTDTRVGRDWAGNRWTEGSCRSHTQIIVH